MRDRSETVRVSLRQLALQIVGMVATFAAALFLPAGTLAWPAGWLYLALFFAFVIALSIWLVRVDPALMAERLGGMGRADQEAWDKALMTLTALLFYAWLAFMALDAVRYRWSRVPDGVQWLGAAMLIISFVLFWLTFRANTYLSPAVRVQRERGQQVVSTGPYRVVRHPLYAALFLFLPGTSLLLGSWYGLAAGVVIIALVARRAVLEERTLRAELPGYTEYAERVRYRLIPYLW